MRTSSKLAVLSFALFTQISVAGAQTDTPPAPVVESIPGVMVMPPRLPMTLPIGQPSDNQDGHTCPAGEQKKLELIG